MRVQSDNNRNPKSSEVLADLLQERYSCRGFLPYRVSRTTIEAILRIAQRTAFWCSSQPWQITIASGEATRDLREKLFVHVQNNRPQPDFPWPSGDHGVYKERRRECGLQLYESAGVAAEDRLAGQRQRLENFRFFGAPHVAIVSSGRELGTYGAIDCGAYVANFALAAHSVGIASIAQAALAAYPDFWREHLVLAEDRLVVCGISFGYEDPDHPANRSQTSRASVPRVVDWVDN